MSVHIDRAHHHPKVYKRDGHWQAGCSRCGLLVILPLDRAMWRFALVVALKHSEAHS